MEIKNVLLIGKGAVGSTMGTFLHQYLGKEHFAFLMEPERKEKYLKEPILINEEPWDFNLVSSPDQFDGADLILIATKYPALQQAIDLARPFVHENTILMSCLNGISSEDDLKKAFPDNDVIRTIAQKMDSRYLDGKTIFSTPGELVFGPESEDQAEDIAAVRELFDASGLPYVLSGDILRDQFKKLMANCGINQVCMAYGATYGQVMNTPELRDLFEKAMQEVMRTANAMGIDLNQKDVDEWLNTTASLGADSMPSMMQDRLNKRKSELALFSGTIVPLAKEYGIETPVLEHLQQRIEQIEAEY